MSVDVAEKPDPAAKFGSQVDDQIAQATGRIRAHDLILGGLTLAAFVTVYATVIILLDRYLVLPEWVRQVALLGFLTVALGIAYWLVVRPLRNRINPLYAAARVESTIEDPKNSVTGYVEARDRGELHTAVKAAMSAKAAQAVGEADVNQAVDHRSLIIAGSVLLVFLLVLAVLFFVFRPDQFRSLMSRAFVPLSSSAISKRTQIEVMRPEPPDPTITTGQSITVTVYIRGKVPSISSPERVRILLRHTQADPNYEVIAMEEGETTRDWYAKVPDYLVQNGFWYKVAGGDNETPEYRVTVRTLPMFTEYESSYEYPAYTRKPNDKGTGPNLRAYKGTKVTLTGKTNREVAEGVMKFDAANLPPVTGRPVPGRLDSLEFKFTATESTRYKLLMTSTTGEKNTDAPSFAITLDSDLPPIVQVTKPDEPEITLVANGQLSVDGTIGDDFGIDKVRLRMRIEDRDLQPLPYMSGQSFLRKKDNTWPTDLAFKLSADLAKLSFADGEKFAPVFAADKPVVIEYWVEAIDNCSEAKPVADWDKQIGNVGRSNVQRVRLAPPVTEPEKKQDLDKQKQQRAGEERQHNQQQQQQLDREKRNKPQPQDGKEQPKDHEGQPDAKKDPDAKGKSRTEGAGGMPDPSNPAKMPPEAKKQPVDQKQSGGKGADNGTGPKSESPTKLNDNKKGMNDPGNGGSGMQEPSANPTPAPMPKSPQVEKDAVKVQDELNKNKGPGGDAKPNSGANAEENRTEPAGPKPQPPPGGMKGMEPQSKPADPMSMGGDKNLAAESKPQGNLEPKPNPDSGAKPVPQQPKSNEPKSKSAQPSEARSEPLGGSPGQDKPEPKEMPKDEPKDPKNPGKDPMSGSAGKPATQKPEPKDGAGSPEPRKEPAGNAAQPKPNAEPERGMDKSATETKPARDGTEGNPQPNAGDAKPKQSPKSAESKPMPKESGMPQEMAAAKPAPAEPKNPADPKSGGASETKPDKPLTPMTGGMDDRGVEKGIDKPTENKSQTAGGSNSAPKGKEDGRKLSEKEKKELQQAAQDLQNPDPAKKKEAQNKLDKAIGKDKRKEVEQLLKDLQSPDKATHDAAQQKADDLMNQAKKDGKPGAGSGEKKLSEQELKDLQQAAQDLQNPDPAKKKEAQNRLYKTIGEDKRKEVEKLQEDLKSPDNNTREAAQKRFENLMNQAKKDDSGSPNGKELSPEEVAELAKKAQDLNSKDEGTRREAEKALDDKLGKEAREKKQDEMKKQDAMDPKAHEDLKKKIDEMARKGKGPIDLTKKFDTPGRSDNPPLPPMEDDPRNRAKTAQLQLEEFEKHRYDYDLHERLRWTQEDYDKFLKAARELAEERAKEAQTFEEELRNHPKPPTGEPTLNTTGGFGKVENRGNGTKVEGSSSGAVVAPTGFENARTKFLSKPKGK